MLALLESVGSLSIRVAEDTGGMVMVLANTLRRLAPPRLDREEFFRAMIAFGEASLPIVLATAGFTGMIMVLQAAVYVEQYGAHELVGWYTGFSTFREVGPILVGLMFSGRVGANNTSELATMKVTEQLDALRILAIDTYEVLILPRALAMTLSLTLLTIFANVMAVLAGALGARALMDIDYAIFFESLWERVQPGDFMIGVEKAAVYGLVIAIVSSYFGLSARGGSTGVGRAVNAQVVGCAVALFVVDYLMTSVIR